MPSDAFSIYASYFTEEERRDLEAVPHDDLIGEIDLLRYMLVLVMSESPLGPWVVHPDTWASGPDEWA